MSQYMKDHCEKNPENKKEYVCDEPLKKLLGVDVVTHACCFLLLLDASDTRRVYLYYIDDAVWHAEVSETALPTVQDRSQEAHCSCRDHTRTARHRQGNPSIVLA